MEENKGEIAEMETTRRRTGRPRLSEVKNKDLPENSPSVRVRTAREKLGLDQKVFGERVGVTPQIISRTENGRQDISVLLLQGMFEAFGIPTEYILGLRPEGEPESLEKLRAQNKKLSDENQDLRERIEEKNESLKMAKELLDFFRNQSQ